MNEIQQAFYELMFGYGKWFGLIFFLSVILLISYRIRKAGILFIPILFFLGMEYSQNVSTSADFFWSVIILFLAGIYLMYKMVSEFRGG